MSRLKKFNEVLAAGYQFPQIVDIATRTLIEEWFYFRSVCDNEKFEWFFNRSLKWNYPYYRQLMRIDPTVSGYDWLISSYMERQRTNADVTDERTTTTGTDRDASSGNDSTQTTRQGTTQDTSTGTDTSTAQGNVQGFERAEALNRQAPYSAEYDADDLRGQSRKSIEVGDNEISGYASGIPKPNITNPTSVSDALTERGELSKTDTSTESETTSNRTDSSTETQTRTTGDTRQHTSEGTQARGIDHSALEREVYSGRSGEVAEMLDHARDYILRSRAWDFLRKELDKCFIQVYEED